MLVTFYSQHGACECVTQRYVVWVRRSYVQRPIEITYVAELKVKVLSARRLRSIFGRARITDNPGEHG